MTGVAPALTGVRIPPLEPGSAEWLQHMSASKIAAVLGLSPYESAFSLWHRMAGLLPSDDSSPHLARGHYLEPGILAWFRDQHPDWTVELGGCWQHPDLPRFTASPDGTAYLPDGTAEGVEIKTAADDDEWGEPGTDEVPVGYRAQVIFQMDVVGTRRTRVAVLSAYLNLREYAIDYDADEAAFIRERGQAFLDSLPGGAAPRRPDIDSHDATYEAVRKLHPEIDRDRNVDLDTDLALRYLAAVAAEKTAKTELIAAKALLLDAMGTARTAKYLDRQIALRKPARGGSVALTCTDKELTA